MPSPIPDFVRTDLSALGLTLSEAQVAQLGAYLDLLLAKNEVMNLTAIKDRDLAWRRLILDSLTIMPQLMEPLPNGERPGNLIDIGSGGGMPGIPIAIACPNLRVTLLDATGKKVAFHKEVIAALELKNCKSIQGRAELLGRDKANHRAKYDIAASRAVGPIAQILEYSVPLMRLGGRMLAIKGPRVAEELDDASDALQLLDTADLQIIPAWPEEYGNDLVIVSLTKMEPTKNAYPREGGLIKNSPLGTIREKDAKKGKSQNKRKQEEIEDLLD